LRHHLTTDTYWCLPTSHPRTPTGNDHSVVGVKDIFPDFLASRRPYPAAITTFFKVKPSRPTVSHNADRLTTNPSRARTSCQVRSGCSAINADCVRHAGEDRRAKLLTTTRRHVTSFAGRCFNRRTNKSLTRYLATTIRVIIPASQSSTNHCQWSSEYARTHVLMDTFPPCPNCLDRARAKTKAL
jgi:hypothetical protein